MSVCDLANSDTDKATVPLGSNWDNIIGFFYHAIIVDNILD